MFYTMFYVVLLCAEFATAMDATAMDAKPSRQWWRSRPKTRRQSGTYDPGKGRGDPGSGLGSVFSLFDNGFIFVSFFSARRIEARKFSSGKF